ncbi:uncharacterized protein LOC110975197 isoform X2 [Acanthaster planci]|uniref:Uncharacterized protein LOC110975197 isoform X2 n=1 Tax=Acanthaster planci TaxID=133434 RepID=A0A8B7XSG0_ACAPL|nr:uncharacterized protein LOC110975197 isoform X2 [Acanthaster planci]
MMSQLLLLLLVCREHAVSSMPVSQELVKPSTFDESQVQDCLSQELHPKMGSSYEIRPGCLHILQHAMFPRGSSFEFSQPSNSLPKRKQVAKITSEDGLHWLWGLLHEDCRSMKELLASLALQIARKEYVQENAVEFHVIDKRQATTTIQNEDQALDLFRHYMTAEALAKLMGDRPSSTDLIGIDVPVPTGSAVTITS